MIEKSPKRVLLCPLNWGLGHLTRSESIAKLVIDMGFDLTVAASGRLLESVSDDLPVRKVLFKSIRIRYSSVVSQYLAVLVQLPIMIIQVLYNHYMIGRIIRKHNIDILISDNRPGLWSKHAYTIYITHQLTIKSTPFFWFLEPFVSFLHRKEIEKYNECWIPDLPGEINLAGMLSHPSSLPSNVRYVGLLSRLPGAIPVPPDPIPSGRFITLLLSGPEPQRTILEEKLLSIPYLRNKTLAVIGGQPQRPEVTRLEESSVRYGYLGAGEIKYLLKHSEAIICRSGYSTVMDLALLGLTALLIPTPGQPEQQYLAEYLSSQGWFNMVLQKDIDDGINRLNSDLSNLPPFTQINNKLLDQALLSLSDQD